MTTEPYIVTATDVSKQIVVNQEPLVILDGLNLQIKAGEHTAILGVSGSGKTTLLSLIAGFDIATSGSLKLLGSDLSKLDEDQRAALRLNRVAFLFQDFQLIPYFTALENIMLPLLIAGDKQAKAKAKAMLEQLGLDRKANILPSHLSGGEQQRIAIARALVVEPEVLLLDEPTGSLDHRTGMAILDFLFANNTNKATIICVTHDYDVAQRMQQQFNLVDGGLVAVS